MLMYWDDTGVPTPARNRTTHNRTFRKMRSKKLLTREVTK